jgi:antitoxin component of MazEF toxin-antitoxin module
MRIPIIDIGNSKGIRIPQAILKQTLLGEEVDLEIQAGKIILKRYIDPTVVPDFDAIADLDDISIQRILMKIDGPDLITAMIDAEDRVKEALYRNMSERVRTFVKAKVDKLEKSDARGLIIERSRNIISEAFMQAMME